MQDVEGAIDALVGDALEIAIADPAREREQHRRKYQRCNHGQLQQPDGRVARRQH